VPISRRRFLVAAGLPLAAGAAASRRTMAAAGGAPRIAAAGDWSAVREQFDLAPGYAHLSCFYIVSHPQVVREAIERHRRAIDANPFLTLERGLFESESENMTRRVRRTAADYLGGAPEEIALTGNTTTGLALIYNGLTLSRGQEILTTDHDHYVHHESIRLAAERSGAMVRRIALYDDILRASGDDIVERVRRAIGPATRVVGITWVHSSSGLKLPVRRIAQAIADINARRDEADRVLLVVDGVHGLGVEDETVAALGCDFFVAGTHKWIFAPRGTGLIRAPRAAWALVRPTIPSFYAPEVFEAWKANRRPDGPAEASWVSPGGFHAYEHHWAAAEAFRFHLDLGRRRIAERIHELNRQCREGLAKMRHVRLRMPLTDDLTAGLLCFEVQGLTTEAVVRRLLDRRIVASGSPYAPSYPRLAAGLMNTPGEIDDALRAVRALAAA